MCQDIITVYSRCSHEETDSFPCDDVLEGMKASCPAVDPRITKVKKLCPTCDREANEDAEFEAAMKRIAEDESLAPVAKSNSCRDPNAPKELAKTREFYPHCGHYAKVTEQDFEREHGDPEYIDMEYPGSCYGCCEAHPRVMEQMKRDGKWDNDPWGELNRLITAHDEDHAVGGISRISSAEAFHQAPPSEYSDEEEEYDTTPTKNKGVAGQPDRHVHDDSEHHDEPSPDFSNEEHEAPRHGGRPVRRRQSSESSGPKRFSSPPSRTWTPDRPSEVPPPNWSSGALVAGAGAGANDLDALSNMPDEERAKNSIPRGDITNRMVQSIMRRSGAEAGEAVRLHNTGETNSEH